MKRPPAPAHSHEHAREYSHAREHDHDHSHAHGHAHSHAHMHLHSRASRSIGSAFVINAAFTLVEVVGGLLIGSVAVLANAAHDLGDTLTLGFAWYMEHLASKRRDALFSYGYRRFSLLSALVSGLTIVAASTLIVREALPRLWQPQAPQGPGMIGLALLGVAFNAFAAWRLSKGKTQSERVLTWHQIEDSVGWFVVLAGAICLLLFGWKWMDPLLALVLAAVVLLNVVRNLRVTMGLFLQGRPPGFDEQRFAAAVKQLPNVTDLHDLHAWSLDGEHNVLSAHLVLNRGTSRERVVAVKKEVHAVAQSMGAFHMTLETEFEGDACEENCDDPGADRG